MTNFRTKLMQNIETYVKQQYCPTTTDFTNLRIDIGERIISDNAGLLYAARAKDASCPALGDEGTTARNNNGYYYFKRQDTGEAQTLEFS